LGWSREDNTIREVNYNLEIKSYKGKYPEVTRLLYQKGILARLPKQVKRDDLMYAEGIDIHYDLVGMTPAKFKEYSDSLLWIAYEEALRYNEEPIKFARFDVALNRTEKGRKMMSNPIREYTARGNPEADVMVFGEGALGYEIPEGMKKPFLINKVDEILGLTDSISLKPYIQVQRPYKVVKLVISIRKKFPLKSRQEEREEKEAMRERKGKE
jgi:hypothetical protein